MEPSFLHNYTDSTKINPHKNKTVWPNRPFRLISIESPRKVA
ncbi:hypothetical protein ACM6L3_17535 [Paenibacillus larvae]